MKKSIIAFFLFTALFTSANAQAVKGTFSPLQEETRVNFIVDFSEADIMGMSEDEFYDYEEDWEHDKVEVLSLFTNYANDVMDNVPRLGNYKNVNYTLKLIVRAVDIKGNYDCDVLLMKGDDVIGEGIGLMAKGGKFGSKLNLMKDGAENTGKALGKFLLKAIKMKKPGKVREYSDV